MKIEWATPHSTPMSTDVRVVRVDELQQWVNDKKLDIVHSYMNYDEICAYRLALTQLLDELEVKP